MNHIVANRYELLKEVGRGGTSVVYLASDTTLNKNWAVKKVEKEAVLNGRKVSNKLLAEANMMKNLDHPALPRIVDVIEENDCYYIIMDFVEGETLENIMQRTGAQDQERVIQWGIELCSILKYLHSQDPPIIYRDLKPANIILQPNNTLKLIDFGIARTYKEGKTKDTTTLGTKGYAAPEQYASNSGKVMQSDARTDIYNLAVTLYELVTGKDPTEPPYKVLPIRQVNPLLSEGLEKIILKCTNQDPDERFQTADDLMQVLLNYEKLDNRYILEKTREIKKVRLPFYIGIVCILLSICLFITSAVLNNNSYEKLLLDTGNSVTRTENLMQAIQTKPSETTAYSLLIEELAKDGQLTEDESEKVYTLYNDAIGDVRQGSDAFLDINYTLGENYLIYFTGETDNSIRNRLLTAMPFFEAVVNNGNEKYQNYALAKSYYELGQFYRQYIIGEDLMVKEATREDYQNLFDRFNQTLNEVSKISGSQIKLVTCNIVMSIIDIERYNITNCMSEEDVIAVVNNITKIAENVKTSNAAVIETKQQVINDSAVLTKKIKDAYNEAEKVEK